MFLDEADQVRVEQLRCRASSASGSPAAKTISAGNRLYIQQRAGQALRTFGWKRGQGSGDVESGARGLTGRQRQRISQLANNRCGHRISPGPAGCCDRKDGQSQEEQSAHQAEQPEDQAGGRASGAIRQTSAHLTLTGRRSDTPVSIGAE